MASGALLSFFLNGSIAATYAYTPELFPTWTRTTATGLASAFGRLGSISAPAIIGFTSSSLGFGGVFGMTCAVLAAGVVGVLVFGVSTAGHSLEQLNERAPERRDDRPSRLAHEPASVLPRCTRPSGAPRAGRTWYASAGSDDRPVDLRITDGVVTEVGPDLPATCLATRSSTPRGGGRSRGCGTTTSTSPRGPGRGPPSTSPGRRSGRRDAARGRPPRGAGRRERPRLVSGFGYRSGAWDRIGTVAELDAATGDVPVMLTSGDAHNGWLNSAALGLLGVAGVTGPLEENDWFGLQPSISALLEEIEAGGAGETALRSAMADAAARGITGVVDLEMPSSYRQWPSRFADGLDLVRVRASVYPDALDDLLAARRPHRRPR